MCGIAGIFDPEYKLNSHIDNLKSMCYSIMHRGPDAKGEWTFKYDGIYLGHTRLSIIDLNETANQPMVSSCGRYVIIFNGEIYNFKEIKKKIEKEKNIKWKTSSDTEVLLEGISLWGFNKFLLNELNGMFALATWDIKNKKLYLARDHLGEKPLYYSIINGILYFSSDLLSFKSIPYWEKKIDHNAQSCFFRHGYVAGEQSIFKGVYKIKPSNYKVFEKNAGFLSEKSHEYYENNLQIKFNKKNNFKDELLYLLEDSVKLRMISDVPLGSYLSGGIDSSLITALMQKNSSKKVKTFSIGFEEQSYNELYHAKNVSNYLGTDHHEYILTKNDILNIIPNLSNVYSEPFADPSQIPMIFLAKQARQIVKVILSGDGADELFGGYSRYKFAIKVWNLLSFAPHLLQKFFQNYINNQSTKNLNQKFNFLEKYFNSFGNSHSIGDRLKKGSKLLAKNDFKNFYESLISVWENDLSSNRTLGYRPYQQIVDDHLLTNKLAWMSHMDRKIYLSDNILVKLDRSTMAEGLEGRVPFIDKRICEFSLKGLIKNSKIFGNKNIIKDILNEKIDSNIWNRPKHGFTVPINLWLNNELRDWAEDLLADSSLKKSEMLNINQIKNIWKEHKNKERNWHFHIWNILVYKSWESRWGL